MYIFELMYEKQPFPTRPFLGHFIIFLNRSSLVNQSSWMLYTGGGIGELRRAASQAFPWGNMIGILDVESA